MRSPHRFIYAATLFWGLNICAVANPLSGEQLYDIACQACHSLGHEADHRVGTPLGNLQNRTAAIVQDFQYSQVLIESGWIWTLPTLTAWISDPDIALPNNAMNYVNALTAEETLRLSEWLLRQP